MSKTSLVWDNRQKLIDNDYTNVTEELTRAHRLVEIAGIVAAERITLVATTTEATEAQGAPRKVLVEVTAAAKDLAKDAGIGESIFRFQFPEGDASNLVIPAMALVKQLEEHGPKLNAPANVARLIEAAKSAQKKLTKSELDQEAGKRNQEVPTGTKGRAVRALYAQLLRFARRGRAACFDDPELAAKFSLSLFGGGSTTAGEEKDGEETDEANVTPPKVDPLKATVKTDIPVAATADAAGAGKTKTPS